MSPSSSISRYGEHFRRAVAEIRALPPRDQSAMSNRREERGGVNRDQSSDLSSGGDAMPVIGPWIVATTDKAHAENWGGDHRSGFCKACADVYLTLNHVAADHRGAVDALRIANARGRATVHMLNHERNVRGAETEAWETVRLEPPHVGGQSETAPASDDSQQTEQES